MSEAPDTQIFRIFIKATPDAIWQAITSPEWTERYGYKGRTIYDLRVRRSSCIPFVRSSIVPPQSLHPKVR